MPRQIRIRDETGGSVYYDASESPPSDYTQSDYTQVSGAGVFDIMKNVVSKVVTSKAAKKMATKAAEKLVEKSAEKTGQKIGDLIGEKIYNSFNSNPSADENRGDLIIKEFQKLKKPEHKPRPKPSFVSPSKTRSISEQFDELLAL